MGRDIGFGLWGSGCGSGCGSGSGSGSGSYLGELNCGRRGVLPANVQTRMKMTTKPGGDEGKENRKKSNNNNNNNNNNTDLIREESFQR